MKLSTPLSIPRWLDRVLLLVGLGLLVYVVSRYPMADIEAACLLLGPRVALMLAIALGVSIWNTLALYILLDRRVPWLEILRIRLIGDGYNALLPLAGMGGEPYKVKHLSATVPVEAVTTALILDRLLENAVGMLYTSVFLAIAMGRYVLAGTFRAALVGYIIIASAAGIAIFLVVLTNLPGRIAAALAGWLGAKGDGAIVRLPRARLARLLWCYLASRVTSTLEVALLLWLLGFGCDPITVLFGYSVLNAAGFIGFAIPAGLGVAEGSSVYLFSVLGFPGPAGVAFALARRGRMLVVSMFGVALHLASLRRRKTP